MKKGIDVSHHQGEINFEAIKDKVDFIIIRLGYGIDKVEYDDRYFRRNVDECIRLNIPFGVYLYSYATNKEEAISEANHTLRLIKDLKFEYPVFYDVEDKAQEKLPKETLIDIVDTYCSIIESNNYYVGIYANLYFLTNLLNDSRLDRYDKWLAQWASKPTYDKPYGMWQYTSKLEIEGINGYVDGDIAYLDYPTIIKSNNLNNFKQDSKLKYSLGETLYLTGYLYRDSYGFGRGKKIINKQVTITRINPNGSKPYNVDNGLGWVSEADLTKKESKFQVGDKVRIIKTGNGSSDGSGKTAYGLFYKREILRVLPNAKYPYQVGNSTGTTGFYKEDALKLID